LNLGALLVDRQPAGGGVDHHDRLLELIADEERSERSIGPCRRHQHLSGVV